MRTDEDDDTRSYVLGGMLRDEVWRRYPHPISGLVGSIGLSCAYCGAKGCFRACLEHLEKRGMLTKTNKYPYHQTDDSETQSHMLSATRTLDGGDVCVE